MNHPVFALFERQLRQDARAIITYGARLALVLVILFSLVSAQATTLVVGAPGLSFFSTVVFINFFFISLAGLGYFSSAITEEKEEGTLGLLRMTGMQPLAILLGKSTARLLGALLFLLAQLPFTLLAVTLGGVSLTQILAAYATLIAYMLLL